MSSINNLTNVQNFCLTWEAIKDGYLDNDGGVRDRLAEESYLNLTEYLKRIHNRLPDQLIFKNALEVVQRVVELRKSSTNTFKFKRFLEDVVPNLEYNYLDPKDEKGGNILSIQFLLLLEMGRREFGKEHSIHLKNDSLRRLIGLYLATVIERKNRLEMESIILSGEGENKYNDFLNELNS